MVNEVNFKNYDNILPPPTTDEYCGTSDECYPPQYQETLMITLKYIRDKEYKKDLLKAYRTFNQSAAQRIYYLLNKYVTYVVVIAQNLYPFQPLQIL